MRNRRRAIEAYQAFKSLIFNLIDSFVIFIFFREYQSIREKRAI